MVRSYLVMSLSSWLPQTKRLDYATHTRRLCLYRVLSPSEPGVGYLGMAAKVFIAGGVSFDTIIHLERFPEPRQATVFARESYEAAGATSTGKALNLAALGHHVTLAAQLGPDHFSDLLRDRFREAGVALHELPDVRTERHTNLMNPAGKRISIFAVQRTFAPEVRPQDFEAAVAEADAVILDIVNWSRQLIPLVKAHGTSS